METTDQPLNDGFECRPEGARNGRVFATRAFAAKDVLMVAQIARFFDKPRAGRAQVGEHIYVEYVGCMNKLRHSCDPNCGIRLDDAGAHSVVARRPIAKNDELTLDFAMQNYRSPLKARNCGCGAPSCRKTVTGWAELSDDVKKDYAAFAAPFLAALDNKYRE